MQLPRAERFRMKVVVPPKDASRKGGRVLAAAAAAAYTKRYAATIVTNYTCKKRWGCWQVQMHAACRKRWDELVGPNDTCGKGWFLQLLHTSLCIHR